MDGKLCPTSNAQQLRVVQQLLWDVISLHLYPAERDEIRRALGRSLLDENESLFAEAGALADILGDVQLNTAALLARHSLCSNPQRSMVEAEIRLLIDRLHASASTSPFGSAAVRERDPESLMPRSGRRDKAVLEYVTTVAQIAETGGRPPSAGLPPRPPSTAVSSSSRPGTSSRPPTALSASAASAAASISLPSPLSRPGTASPTLQGSRPSTASSAASSAATRYTDAPSVVAGVADKLNVSNIDAVRETLRTALLDERAVLLEDIEYLQGLLDAEADLQVRAAAPPPSLAELRDYSSRLAAVVADEEARLEHEVRVSAMFAAAEQQSSKAGRLRGMVDASRRPTSGGSGGGGGNGIAAAAGPRRGSVGGGSGGAQTLVVVHGDGGGGGEEDAARQSQQRQRLPSGSSMAAGTAGVVAGLVGGLAHSRPGPLAAVRRPGSGGSGAAASAELPPVLPPPAPALRPLAGSLPAARLSHSPSAAVDAAAGHPKAPDSNGLSASASPSLSGPGSSRLLHSPSPGRLRPVGQPTATGAASSVGPLPPSPSHTQTLAPQQQQPSQNATSGQQQQQQQPQSLSQPQSHRDKSPSLRAPPSPARLPSAAVAASANAATSLAGVAGGVSSSSSAAATTLGAVTAAKAGGAGSAVTGSALRAAPPRSGSVGRAGPAPVAVTAPPSAAASSSSSSSSSSAARSSGRVSSSAIAGEGGVAEPYQIAVQPRALMGNKQSVVERLDEEVDKVKGGLAAILERYNIRPSTPSSQAAAAPAPPPASLRGL